MHAGTLNIPQYLRRRTAIILLAITVVAFLLCALLHATKLYARSQLQSALGPHGSFDELTITPSRVIARGIRIGRPDARWPADMQLHASTVTLDISPRQLLLSPRVISRASIDGLYLAIVRNRDGSTHVVPELSEVRRGASDEAAQPGKALLLEELELRDAAIDFIDDSMPRRVRMRVTGIAGTIRQLKFPEFDERSTIELAGTVPGRHSRGDMRVSGAMTFATLDGKLALRWRKLDLTSLDPYLVKSMRNGVAQGTLDMTLSPVIAHRRVIAKGHVDIHGLKLSKSDDVGASFLSMPRAALLASLEDHNGTISTDVTLQGNLDDPKFSIDDSLQTQIGLGAAAALGVSLIGVAQGVGTLGVEGVKAVGNAVSGN